MTFDKLSEKQLKVLNWWSYPPIADNYNSIICDGAVRSGKTIVMTVSFIIWSMQTFNQYNFGICGKTVRSTERNIILPIQQVSDLKKLYILNYTRSTSLITISDGINTNYFYLFGGKDESSYTLIQGITLAGIMFDEVALMPRSFVEQAISRTLSVSRARLWFNCNPENPSHWFYNEWIKRCEKKGALHLHFLMDDNPTLTKEDLQKAENMFSGVFYSRYIKGEWVRAEGAIYRIFIEDRDKYLINDVSDYLRKTSQHLSAISFGVDFGGNKSATVFTATGITGNYKEVIVISEEFISEEINPDDLNNRFALFIQKITGIYGAGQTRADSAETILIRGLYHTIKVKGLRTQVKNALKMKITDRIRLENLLMSQQRIKVCLECKHLVEAFSDAVYDPGRFIDTRLDDGTSNIDSLDAFEYSIEPFYKELEMAGFKMRDGVSTLQYSSI